MVATRYVYSRGRRFFRGMSAVCAIFLGFVAVLFAKTPKVLTQSEGGKAPVVSFPQNVAHAEIVASDGFPSDCFAAPAFMGPCDDGGDEGGGGGGGGDGDGG